MQPVGTHDLSIFPAQQESSAAMRQHCTQNLNTKRGVKQSFKVDTPSSGKVYRLVSLYTGGDLHNSVIQWACLNMSTDPMTCNPLYLPGYWRLHTVCTAEPRQ